MAKATEEKKLQGVRAVTKTFRLSFPHLDKPHKAPKSKEPKFSVAMLFPKDGEGFKHAKGLLRKAAAEQWGKDPDSWPKIKWPWKDGDKDKKKKGYAGHYVINADCNQEYPPSLYDREGEDILNAKRDLYAGCYARAEVTAKAIDGVGEDDDGNPRNFVKFYLNAVQFVKNGEKLGGRDSKAAFDAVDFDDSGSDDDNTDDSDDGAEDDYEF